MGACDMPGTVLSAARMLTHTVFTLWLGGRYCLHFTDVKTEAQRQTYLRSPHISVCPDANWCMPVFSSGMLKGTPLSLSKPPGLTNRLCPRKLPGLVQAQVSGWRACAPVSSGLQFVVIFICIHSVRFHLLAGGFVTVSGVFLLGCLDVLVLCWECTRGYEEHVLTYEAQYDFFKILFWTEPRWWKEGKIEFALEIRPWAPATPVWAACALFPQPRPACYGPGGDKCSHHCCVIQRAPGALLGDQPLQAWVRIPHPICKEPGHFLDTIYS